MSNLPQVDISKPKWDQSTYIGRAKHFFLMTNPLNIFATPTQLQHAKEIYNTYRAGKSLPPGTTMDDVWRAKYLYDSAYHPDTGEKMFVVGRMAAQMPMNTLITAGLMTFYKTTKGVVFWQWINQSFNATVNYTNRSGDAPISLMQLGTSYVLATGGALSTALFLNKQVSNFFFNIVLGTTAATLETLENELSQRFPSLIGRLVPFTAVAAANCINIPCMRARELRDGVPIIDSNNNKLGNSMKAAREGISAVVFSRIAMATPSMICIPVIVNYADKRGLFKIYPKGPIILNTGLCAIILTFATPMCCALFSQQVAVKISHLEDHVQEAAKKINPPPTIGYYNKGL